MTLRLLPRTLGAQGQRQASFLGGIFGSGEKKAGIATEATFDYHPYKLHQLDEGPATTTTITRDEALRIYREMVTIRYKLSIFLVIWRKNEVPQENGDCGGQLVQGEGHQRVLPPLLWPGSRLLRHEGWHQGAGLLNTSQ